MKDPNCKCGYLREEELIGQFVGLLDKIEFDEVRIKHKFDEEVARIKKFQRSFFEGAQIKKQKEISIKDYAKYVLMEGNVDEKRNLLGCILNKIQLKERILILN